jgi:UDP-N-acetylglucosamine 2-epimerase (hydrolysing)
MHLNPKYSNGVNEISRQYPKNYFPFYNHTDNYSMDETLAKTIDGFGLYVKDVKPDAIFLHGDRVEALAAAVVGGLNNILTCSVEGGEVSGTIDEHIRHAITKLTHVHFVSNKVAKKRLMQMGEKRQSIFVIGSPDIDIMLSKNLPSLQKVKKYYDIDFENYAILMYHPVTTELKTLPEQIEQIMLAVRDSILHKHNGKFLRYVIISPNNDTGNGIITTAYEKCKDNPWWSSVKQFPNLKFEYFLTLLKNARFIIGNSSAGIREAGYYNVPCVNIGTRQQGRSNGEHIINCKPKYTNVLESIDEALEMKPNTKQKKDFGTGNSAKQFLAILKDKKIWNTPIQKKFIDLNDF